MAYFPNGTSGEVFDEQCGRCRYGEGFCPIWGVQNVYNYDACNNEVARKILYDLVKDDGTCAMFKLDEAWFDKERVSPNEAEAAYYALTPETPQSIRDLVLQAAGRVAS